MAGDPQNFADLKIAVLSWLNRDDLDGNVEEFIALAERRLSDELRVSQGVSTLSATTGTVALPADFGGIRALWIGTPRRVIAAMDLDALLNLSDATGVPTNYAVVGSDMLLAPAPSSSTTLSLVYWKNLPALSDSNTSNWLLLARPDIYIDATLVEAFLYVQNAEMAMVYESRVVAKIASLNRKLDQKQYAGPQQARARVVA